MPEERNIENTEGENMTTPERPQEGGSVAPEKLPREIKPIAGGAPWLYEKPEDLAGLASEELRSIVELVELTQPNSSGILRDYYLQIVGLVKERKTTPREAQDFLIKIGARIEEFEVQTTTRGIFPQEVKIDLEPLQQALLEGVETQRLTLAQFINLAEQQTQDLAESLRRISPEKERERWMDVEYAQEFYTRFTPTMEPRFYTELSHTERELFDARWQLARAAYFKKAYSAFPEKQFENQDLNLLSIEQMERLYKMPGVKEALEWYADVITKERLVDAGRGRMTIWQCKNEIDFEQFRETMRKQALSGLGLGDLAQKEADAVAWNWIWCSNLVESADSRYSFSKERHGDLPGVLVSDDVRALFHPQEKYEDKCRSGLEWGAFGKWGMTQVRGIMAKYGVARDNISFTAASSPDEFWSVERRNGKMIIKTPECYPVITMKSFWEETTIKTGDSRKPLLDYLLERNPIPWQEVGADPWIGYLPIRMNKAVAFFAFYNPGQPAKDGWVTWVRAYLEPYRRLDFERERERAELEKKADKVRYLHNLKVWAVYAAMGGVREPHTSKQTHPIPSKIEWSSLAQTLRMHQVGFLRRGLGAFTGESLSIE